MKSMCKHWGLHISTYINCLGAVLGLFWAIWRGLFWCLKAKLRSWQSPRYWRFNKQYHGGYQLICLISRPLLIASRRDWYQLKGLLKGFKPVFKTVGIIKELVEIWLNEVCDTEYVALSDCSCQLIWTSNLLSEIGFDIPVPHLYGNNLGSLFWSTVRGYPREQPRSWVRLLPKGLL